MLDAGVCGSCLADLPSQVFTSGEVKNRVLHIKCLGIRGLQYGDAPR